MLENFDFRDGEIYFNYMYRFTEDMSLEEYERCLSQDLLAVYYFEKQYLIDVGSYSIGENDIFIVRLIKDDNWDEPPLLERKTESVNEIELILEEFIDLIYTMK